MGFTNNFELKAAKNILMFGLNEKEQSVMKTVLNYFGFLVRNEMPSIKYDLYIATYLKEMDRVQYGH